MKHIAHACLAAVAGLAFSAAAQAQQPFPSKPVRVVIGFPAVARWTSMPAC